MLRQNTNALGIIFPNSYDNTVPELVTERAMASIPFAGRYRMVDFVLSSMANCGISNVSIVVRKNYHSLMDHLGTGREWDMARRHGGLNIVPPFAEKGVRIYSGRVEALGSILSFLEHQKEKYVVMSDAIRVRLFWQGLETGNLPEAFPANKPPHPGYVSGYAPAPIKGNYAKPAHRAPSASPHNQLA